MSIWWLIPAFVGLVGLLSVIGGLGRIFSLRVVSGAFRFLFGGVLLAGAAVVALIGLNLQTYARLTKERLAAEVSLHETSDGFTADVAKADDKGVLGAPATYPVTGDSVRIEADVVTFKPWANILGMDALYRFDRIQGRYDSEAQENATPPTALSMRDAAGVNLFDLPLGAANPFQRPDAEFINGVAVPMADGAVYELHMTQRGLIPRAKNEAAQQAVEQRRQGRKSGEIYGPPSAPQQPPSDKPLPGVPL